MKKYMLKKWYPSLDERLEVGDIGDRYLYEFGNGTKEDRFSVLKGGRLIYIPVQELHPDFWELIEEEKPKPLFITADGVEVFLGHSYILIDKEFIKHKQTASNIVYTEYFKKFKHESNADEYIWRNKRVFSYEDFIKWGNIPYPRAIEQLAKGRAKE